MKKKTIIICIFFIFLLVNSIATSGINIISIEKIKKQNPSIYKTKTQFTEEGNLIINEYLENQNENAQPIINEGMPDLKIADYRAAWVFNEFYYNDYGIFIYVEIINIGSTYDSDNVIKVVVSFFTDNETTPIGTLIATPFSQYTWKTYEVLSFGWFFLSSIEPETLTVKIEIKWFVSWHRK